MAPRGVKALLQSTAPAHLVRCRRGTHFRYGKPRGGGDVLRGLTRCLERRIFSQGVLPLIALRGNEPVQSRAWRRAGGGLARGTAIDSQVSRLATAGASARDRACMFKLTRHFFAWLGLQGLEPLMGQRAVASRLARVGTAIDVVCYCTISDALVLIELKTGYSGSRNAAAELDGLPCRMEPPLDGAWDTVLNRHCSQLAVTKHLLLLETSFLAHARALGVKNVRCMLVYVNDSELSAYPLPKWWDDKAKSILNAL